MDVSGEKCYPIRISVAAKDRRRLSSFMTGAILTKIRPGAYHAGDFVLAQLKTLS